MGPTTHDLPTRDVMVSFLVLVLAAIATIVSGMAT